MIVNAISESIDVSAEDLTTSFLTLVERHLRKEVSNPRSLNAKAENHTLLEQHRNVRRLQKNSRIKEASLVTKSGKSLKKKNLDTTQEKIENFMTSSEQLD